MEKRLAMDEVFKIDGYGLMIVFSDQTSAQFTVDELARLRPLREKVEKLPTYSEPPVRL